MRERRGERSRFGGSVASAFFSGFSAFSVFFGNCCVLETFGEEGRGGERVRVVWSWVGLKDGLEFVGC